MLTLPFAPILALAAADGSWLDPQLFVVAAAVFAGLFVQSAVGFGAGMFSVPLMLWAGLDLPVAISVLLSVVFFQTAWQSWSYRKVMPYRAVGTMALPRLLGTPLGIWVLGLLSASSKAQLQLLLGIFLLAALAVQGLVRVQPRQRIAGYWALIAGSLSGFFAGLFGMGGPPLVLWMLAHDWPPERSRSFLWGSFLLLGPVQIWLLGSEFGAPVLEGMRKGLLLLPVLFAASWLGERTGRRLSRVYLRGLTFLLLAALAIRTSIAAMV
ncbi:MAG: hypothetical protein CSA62_12850 [Planctomycetota bacterium]|nr:MAG: hypothetical protein CSA62_12850 [Planctomycetota bacterium]